MLYTLLISFARSNNINMLKYIIIAIILLIILGVVYKKYYAKESMNGPKYVYAGNGSWAIAGK